MDRVLIDGKEYAVGLSWDVAEGGATKKAAIRSLVEGSADYDAGVIRVPKGSDDAQVGQCDSALKGVKSAAAIFADAVDGVNSIGLFTCKNGTDTAWWLIAVVDGFVIPGGDAVFSNLASALTQVRDLRQIASSDHPVERFVVSDDLDSQVADAELVSFADFAAGASRHHEVGSIDLMARQKLIVMAFIVLAVLCGAGYYVYENYGVDLGVKEPEMTGKTPEQIKSELVRKADGVLMRGLADTPTFSDMADAVVGTLNKTPLFVAGWEVLDVVIDKDGNATMPLERVEGSIYSLRGAVERNGWTVNIADDGDTANWSISYPKAKPVGSLPTLPNGKGIREDLVNLFQLAGYSGYEFSQPAPIIRPNEIPANVDFENPGYITSLTFNGDHMGDLTAITGVVSQYPTARFVSLTLQVERGEYSKWTLKGELYEK